VRGRWYREPVTALAVAFVLTLPWVGAWATGVYEGFGEVTTVATSGVAVLGASFLLAWAAETAEEDVPRAFALAVLAVLAVAPEYAVDALYAWGAGSKGATAEACTRLAAESPGIIESVADLPRGEIDTAVELLALGCHEGNLAVANMTGANRILIGIGWAGIAAFTVWQARRTRDPAVESRPGLLANVVHLDRSIATEITFLLLATAWAFFVPLFGGIDVLDLVILVGLYVVYIGIIIRGDVAADTEHVGVPKYLQNFRRPVRVPVVLLLFVYSGFLILTAVEPFAHGLEDIGKAIGIPAFFMIQWIAPLASEAPELIVVAVLVWKARSTAGFNALISSKLNQWTLLIGTLVVVYSLALGQYGTLPFDFEQTGEIWITAAQSYFAVALLVNFTVSVREATALFGLFISQVALEFGFLKLWVPFTGEVFGLTPKLLLLLAYTVVYLVLGTALFVARRRKLRYLLRLSRYAAATALGRPATRPERGE
jgi:cation:H+ antiporter